MAAARDNGRVLKRLREEVIDVDADDDEASSCKVIVIEEDEALPCEVIVIGDDAPPARREEKDLHRDFRKILLHTEDGGATGHLGRYMWSFLDTRSRFSLRMVNGNRCALPIDGGAPISGVVIEFQTCNTAVALSTVNFKPFTDLSYEEQTPSELLTQLARAGLDLIGERFFPAKNAAYVLQSPFSDTKYARLSARQKRVDLISALRQRAGNAEEVITVVVAGPIPAPFIPSINAKEREMQLQWGFFKDLYRSDLTKAATERLHADAITATIEDSNDIHAARTVPIRWPEQFTGSFKYDGGSELLVVVEDD